MFKVIRARAVFLFSKLQPAQNPRRDKQVPSPKQVQPGTLQAQKLNNYYLQLNSLPTDPIELIRIKYIFKKKKLGNRRLYMPNKREYLRRLDLIINQIEKNHHEVIARDNYMMPTTIGEKIKIELDNEKVRFYFNLVNDDPKMVAIMAALIFCLAVFELWTCEMPRQR